MNCKKSNEGLESYPLLDHLLFNAGSAGNNKWSAAVA